MILANHGLLIVGTTVESAAWWFLAMERCCQIQLLAQAVGGPNLLAADVAEFIHQEVGAERIGVRSFIPIYTNSVAMVRPESCVEQVHAQRVRRRSLPVPVPAPAVPSGCEFTAARMSAVAAGCAPRDPAGSLKIERFPSMGEQSEGRRPRRRARTLRRRVNRMEDAAFGRHSAPRSAKWLRTAALVAGVGALGLSACGTGAGEIETAAIGIAHQSVRDRAATSQEKLLNAYDRSAVVDRTHYDVLVEASGEQELRDRISSVRQRFTRHDNPYRRSEPRRDKP